VAAAPGSGPGAGLQGPGGSARDADQRARTESRASRPGSPSSTASPGAASCRAPRFSSAASPGIGKSTLLLQLGAAFANAGRRAIYFSGEEAAAQVRLRAERLGLSQAPLALACETNLANILATLAEGKRPDLVVVDSIQTLWADGLEARPAR
jgi:DNA repair protein RadA/Sms